MSFQRISLIERIDSSCRKCNWTITKTYNPPITFEYLVFNEPKVIFPNCNVICTPPNKIYTNEGREREAAKPGGMKP